MGSILIYKHHNQINNEKILNLDQKKKFNPELKARINVSLKFIDGSEIQKEKISSVHKSSKLILLILKIDEKIIKEKSVK